MMRRLVAVLAALTCFAGLVAAGSPGAAAQLSVEPTHGTYRGHDAHHRTVSFTLVPYNVMHFTVNDRMIGSAHLADDHWPETCHNGFCTKGRWETEERVVGEWRHGDGHWVHFSAHFQPASSPGAGTYWGYDHGGRSIDFVYGNGEIGQFEFERDLRGGFEVSGSRFDACMRSICVKGHWQTNTYVVGAWRPVHGTQWTRWQAHLRAY